VLVAITKEVQEGRIKKAIVGDTETKVGVLCVRLDSGGWEPVAMVRGESMGELPSCFELNDEAIAVLNQAIVVAEHD
jgi:hypothetical protein